MASVVVLGTPHQLQGIQNLSNSVADPDYAYWVEQLICREQIDFIFEEASGLGPTTAQQLAQRKSIHYLDIDPHKSERQKFGIAEETDSVELIDEYARSNAPEVARWVKVEDQAKREALWLRKILEQNFKNGLVICGFFHTLSFALRLRSARLETKACYYMPHHKLRVLTVAPGTTNRTK